MKKRKTVLPVAFDLITDIKYSFYKMEYSFNLLNKWKQYEYKYFIINLFIFLQSMLIYVLWESWIKSLKRRKINYKKIKFLRAYNSECYYFKNVGSEVYINLHNFNSLDNDLRLKEFKKFFDITVFNKKEIKYIFKKFDEIISLGEMYNLLSKKWEIEKYWLNHKIVLDNKLLDDKYNDFIKNIIKERNSFIHPNVDFHIYMNTEYVEKMKNILEISNFLISNSLKIKLNRKDFNDIQFKINKILWKITS